MTINLYQAYLSENFSEQVNQYDFLYNYRIIMFIRVVLLIDINTNNSYITTLQELSVCVFIETISISVKTHPIPAPSIVSQY